MTDINHQDREHSIYSPSAFSRWSRCPASALRCVDAPRRDSEASLRGTWMHEQCELLATGKVVTDTKSKYNTPSNMEDVVAAVKYVKDYAEGMEFMSDILTMLGARITLDGIGHEDVFGTGDVTILSRDELCIIDYKFGQFPVKAEGNGQMMIYAMGALLATPEAHRPKTITMIIVQPALPGFASVHRMTDTELYEWSDSQLLPAIAAAKKEDAVAIPGDVQCKWCDMSGQCKEQTNEVMDVFEENSASVNDLREDGIGELLPQLPMIESWIKSVRAVALTRMEQGEDIPGYKLVRKTTKRKWLDEEKAEKWLSARKIAKDERTVTKLISIAQAEKKLKDTLKNNPRLQTNFGKLINKPEGAIAMAPKADKRPEVELDSSNPLI